MRTLFLFLLLPVFIHAQQIRGKLLDRQTNEGLPFAVVFILSPEPAITAQADVYGNFTLNIPGKGKYLLCTEYSGFETEIIPVAIDSVKTYAMNFSMCLSEKELIEVKPPPAPSVSMVSDEFHYGKTDSGAKKFIPDTLHITNIRHAGRDSTAAHLLAGGMLIRCDSSGFYFINGGCPDYVFYRKRGDRLVREFWSYRQPKEFIFRKTRHGWKIRCNGVTAVVGGQ